jgi:hypothetical protein
MSKQVPPGGPYMNGDGDWWVAREDASLIEARRLVKGSAWDSTRIRYVGREVVTLMDCDEHDHEVDAPPCQIEGCRRVEAWHFSELPD